MDNSFIEVYELHVDAIYRFIHRLLGNPTDAEDMTAETFLRAYQGWSELLDPAERYDRGCFASRTMGVSTCCASVNNTRRFHSIRRLRKK